MRYAEVDEMATCVGRFRVGDPRPDSSSLEIGRFNFRAVRGDVVAKFHHAYGT